MTIEESIKRDPSKFQEIIDAQADAVLDIPFNSAVSSAAYAAAQGIMDGSIDGAGFTAALQTESLRGRCPAAPWTPPTALPRGDPGPV